MNESVLDLQVLPLGPLQTNCYVAAPAGEKTCWVFDPSDGVEALVHALQSGGMTVERIAITHCHGDHIGGVRLLKEAFPQAVLTAPAGEEDMLVDAEKNLSGPFGMPMTSPPADVLVRSGEALSMGADLEWRILDSAGHTPASVSYYCPAAGLVIVGDALFAGSVGRCDIPGADFGRLIENIRQNLLTLPDVTKVYPGHGPATTIDAERKSNPYL